MRRLAYLVLISLSVAAQAHYDGAYYHGSVAVANNSHWMSLVDGTKKVSELSIPGTHDTMSFYGGDITQTQSMSLQNQLDSGVRALDIRVKYDSGSMGIYHGIVFQHAYLGQDVFQVITEFLTQNPGETIIMHVQQEEFDNPVGVEFGQALDSLVAQYSVPIWTHNTPNPMLFQLRGKVVMLYSNFTPQSTSAVPTSWFSTSGQGWVMNTNWELHDKWQIVKGHLETADSGSPDTKYWHSLTFSTGSFPYFVASGHSSNGTSAPRLATGLTTPGWNDSYPDFPRVACFIGICTIAFEGLNTLAADYIDSTAITGDRLGVVWMDFPGERLINIIIDLNGKGAVPGC